MIATTTITVKSVSAGGLSMLLLSTLNDVEFVVLLSVGIFSSVTSFIYDWSHRDHPKTFKLAEAMELFKYVLYGIAVMFVVYYLGTIVGVNYIDFPQVVWGVIAMISAGSAISIVEWFSPIIGKIISVKASR